MSAVNPSLHLLQQQAASLLLYRDVVAQPIAQQFLQLLTTLQGGNATQSLQAYGQWFSAIAATGKSWPASITAAILRSDNPFSQAAQRYSFPEINPTLSAAARHDLHALQQLAHCDPAQLAHWVRAVCKLPQSPVIWTGDGGKTLFSDWDNWPDAIAPLAQHYQQQGVGKWGQYRAFRWQGGALHGIANPDPVQLPQLVGYDDQKAQLISNTEYLLQGLPALHVLLYGSRGSGKSSLIKGLLTAYGDRGLRLIEVTKAELHNLPAILDPLRNLPQKFIIFVDDLSFEEDDEAFKSLKVVLEGSVTARPANVVVYATSNRRHLIREFFEDRPRPMEREEIHSWDTVQEKLSFSDRFGLTLTFGPADQDLYLAIVRHLAQAAGLNLPPDDLDFRARQWATRHNGRSGRTARQFIDHLRAELHPTP
ncbi:ATP-binding protein [Spirulina major CS-329]|uniref:ATP-binding protein n=1 Tax=Spirulina TaxID=1154 RepID=UPI00232D1E83|nr:MULTISPECIES: ATP-binding protein [Spirulina]MDB9494593.1 ATP-binding protein [Spirulina subsalsa CS-330]MDB9504843.1 ATP-binding protein [Spirulina major CS-329]